MPVTETGLLLALLVLMAGTALSALALGGRRALRLPGVALAGAGTAAWLLLDKALEGPLLVDLPGTHGLVLADLLVLPAVGLCAGLALQERREHAPAATRTGPAGPG